MLRVIVNLLLGSASSAGGIFTGYLYLRSLDTGGGWWLLGLTPILVTVGVYLLFQASRTEDVLVVNNEGPTKPEAATVTPAAEVNFQAMLDRNQKLEADYEKTAGTRDKLKILEIAAVAEEQSK